LCCRGPLYQQRDGAGSRPQPAGCRLHPKPSSQCNWCSAPPCKWNVQSNNHPPQQFGRNCFLAMVHHPIMQAYNTYQLALLRSTKHSAERNAVLNTGVAVWFLGVLCCMCWPASRRRQHTPWLMTAAEARPATPCEVSTAAGTVRAKG
jgi:hypothetical protein